MKLESKGNNTYLVRKATNSFRGITRNKKVFQLHSFKENKILWCIFDLKLESGSNPYFLFRSSADHNDDHESAWKSETELRQSSRG